MSHKQKLILLLVVSSVIRLILGYAVDLGNDEVYYWTYVKYPDWSHFDHPPMVGFFGQIFSLNLLFSSELALRLGFIVSGSLSTLLMFLIGKEIKNERTGLIAAVLYNTSIYGFIIGGLFMMPDGPLVLFWMTSLLFFLRFLKASDRRAQNVNLCLSFIGLALAIYSKYQGVYLLFGYGLYMLLHKREALKSPILYVSLFFPALVLAIIVYWNYLNSFSGVSYHSDRVTLFSLDFSIDTFLREVFGQIAYNNPYNYIVILIGLFSFRKKKFVSLKIFQLFMFISLPLIATTLFFSLYRDTLPHWSGVSFLSLAVIAAARLAERPRNNVLAVIIIFFFILYLLAVGVVNKGWIIDSNTKANTENKKLGKHDPTLDMFGWDQFKHAYEIMQEENPAYGQLPIVSDKWYPGSHLFYYVAAPLDKDIFVLGQMNDMHKYYWINKTMKPLVLGQDAIYITYSRNFKDPDARMKNYFNGSTLIKEFPVKRSGKTVEFGYIYLLQDYKKVNLEGDIKE